MTQGNDELIPLGGMLSIDFGEDADVVIIDPETDKVSNIPLVSTWPN